MHNTEKDTGHMDQGLQENEQIEQAIAALQQQPSQEILAQTLTVIRHRMQEGGQLILAVDAPMAGVDFKIQAVRTEDGQQWWAAFTGFDEELKGADAVKSTFLTDMKQLFTTALCTEGIQGVILNPWNRTLMLDKTLLTIILGTK